MRVYDEIISIGSWCAPAWNIRRNYGIEEAFPFDWWITPIDVIPDLLARDFNSLYQSVDISDDGKTVKCANTGIIHHHDFQRDADGSVNLDLASQLPCLREKLRHVVERMKARFSQGDILLVRETTLNRGGDYDNPAHCLPSVLESFKARFPKARFDLLYVTDQSASDITENGSIIYTRALGDRIEGYTFNEPNWDHILSEFQARHCVERAA